jgi:cytochrome c551/c552
MAGFDVSTQGDSGGRTTEAKPDRALLEIPVESECALAVPDPGWRRSRDRRRILHGAAPGRCPLAQSEGCMICHAVDQTRMGPSFKDVAAKYAGDPDASMTLLAELRNGQGHIKVVASKSELQQIIAFVLAVR